ncbi:hypothetical protein GUITHDRAFT_131975 [Guillardia theta CCMP2712]|uniref:C2H2-type domain-containing protein n=1 Tax=Guillardia theta (strain CCMP2712) TaxID=905079 RepID=L1K365_GUITC|nr:hypothetical protein GUITHDRAFT_131975 [Guillardia theta CCMP2712]EKX55032.1 hypothetical protein GUITHDRAFT_131975 [Guillardia theta CCMP2712]|eukprot:XP_005842012.1 hypothetical protein GUITHDRAFT_131975 [Guillardia theta CCMP2712]
MPADIWKRMYKLFIDFDKERARLIENRKAAKQRKRTLTRRVQVEMTWTCPLAKCSRKFNSASRLNQHLCHHFPNAPDTKRFYCRFALCNKSYRDLDRALRHMRNLCPLRTKENRGPWFCQSCGARFEYKNACYSHLVYCQMYTKSSRPG